ncbi:Early nodulin-like protein 2 [Camellia lanceoleosa]|uniref:Early nodulin-like protein 2 n=1 Tax=Camellia lanceoleosa TaxID=1840588 RepID=A0ACC0HEW8_9ERIC|nr:Early nodulin-like protein 2 [Camellia lanceoleosa]
MGSVLMLVLVLFGGLMGLLEAYQFNVGGKDGWVLNPSENYNHWAGRLRFQVNDTLFFKYKKGSNSVLVVTKQDYDQCNTQKPIMKLDNGDSVLKFDRSGLFYFISGVKANCDKGQKLITLVLAVRKQQKSPPPMAAPPAPVGQTPAPSLSRPHQARQPVSVSGGVNFTGGSDSGTFPKSPSPSGSIPSPSPVVSYAPVGQTPALSPKSPSPSMSTPSLSPVASPVGQTPVPSPKSASPSSSTPSPSPVVSTAPVGPTPAVSPAPATAPMTNAPVPSPTSNFSPSSAPANAPVSTTPANSPAISPTTANTPSMSPSPATASTPPSPPPAPSTTITPPPSISASSPSGAPGSTPANNSSAPPPSSAPALTPGVVLVSSITLVLSVCMGSFIAVP